MSKSNGTVIEWRHVRQDYRCRANDCSRLLFRAALPPGSRVEIVCPKCGRTRIVEPSSGPIKPSKFDNPIEPVVLSHPIE